MMGQLLESNRRRVLSGILVLILLVEVGLGLVAVTPVSSQPAVPVPVSPAEGDTVIIPTFSWQGSDGAAYYEVEVGPQSDPATVYWSDTSYHLALTPTDSADFPNEPLYWRVRAYAIGDVPGPWSGKVNFVKHIPAPMLASPTNGVSVTLPTLAWQATEGATYYQVEVTTDPSFNLVDHTYSTFSTTLTPNDTLDQGTWHWRVRGLDADGHAGTNSAARSFVKHISAPVLVSPTDHVSITLPSLAWQAAEGATYYIVEFTTDPSFNFVNETYTTYNTGLTPDDTIIHDTLYWRVRGADADGHEGTNSAARSFDKHIPAPVLISPTDGVTVTLPTLAWQAAEGATYYIVEATTDPAFVSVDHTYSTYNTQLTPVDALITQTYYWRVRGVDADGHEGTNSTGRSFDLDDPPSPSDPAPQLLAPANGATIAVDPNFRWTTVVGADHYRVVVSTEPDFTPSYDAVNTDYTTYTPYTPGLKDTYVDGTYYWRVEARTGGGTVIATSEARTFIKQASLPLVAPTDGVTLTTDPAFQWMPVVGAHYYRLAVSAEPDFTPSYDAVSTDYTAYTPYTPGLRDTYVNDTYYWRVEARTETGAVIATSEARRFVKETPLFLVGPADGATLESTPTFSWTAVVGAHHYRLVVSTEPAFGSTYDAVSTDYPVYTPYTPGLRDTYADGLYYWKVEARTEADAVITTSLTRTFTIGVAYRLFLPLLLRNASGQ